MSYAYCGQVLIKFTCNISRNKLYYASMHQAGDPGPISFRGNSFHSFPAKHWVVLGSKQ